MSDRCSWSDLPPTMCAHCAATATETALSRPNTLPPVVGSTATPDGPQNAMHVTWRPADDKKPEPRDWNDGPKAPKKSSPCRYVEGWGHYLREHEPTCRDRDCDGCKPCTHDQHGNPVRHCKARERCGEHLDYAHPITCPRCIARVRADLEQVERLATLVEVEAMYDGVSSTAAMYAGPVADPERVQRRGLLLAEATIGISDPKHPAMRLLAEFHADNADDSHPLYVLWQWERMLREDYDHPAPRFAEHEVADPRLVGTEKPATISGAVSYLSWVLTDMAQDETQDFGQLGNEIAACRRTLENVLAASRVPERGAPCPACPEPAKRLERRRAHWCDKPDCNREHDTTGARDTWVCPVDKSHWWSEADYRKITYEDAVAEGMKPRRAR